MKKFILDFLRRGLISSGIGPIVLVIIYFILKQFGKIDTLTVHQVCIGVFSTTVLAFIANGINAIYRIERLPILTAFLIHCIVLYIAYLVTYLVNGWLAFGILPIIIFTVIFVVGYFIVWATIYSIIKRKTAKLNILLKEK